MVATLTSVMIDAAAMASTDTDAVPLDDRIAPTPSQPIEQDKVNRLTTPVSPA
jgi:hypothetical protein